MAATADLGGPTPRASARSNHASTPAALANTVQSNRPSAASRTASSSPPPAIGPSTAIVGAAIASAPSARSRRASTSPAGCGRVTSTTRPPSGPLTCGDRRGSSRLRPPAASPPPPRRPAPGRPPRPATTGGRTRPAGPPRPGGERPGPASRRRPQAGADSLHRGGPPPDAPSRTRSGRLDDRRPEPPRQRRRPLAPARPAPPAPARGPCRRPAKAGRGRGPAPAGTGRRRPAPARRGGPRSSGAGGCRSCPAPRGPPPPGASAGAWPAGEAPRSPAVVIGTTSTSWPRSRRRPATSSAWARARRDPMVTIRTRIGSVPGRLEPKELRQRPGGPVLGAAPGQVLQPDHGIVQEAADDPARGCLDGLPLPLREPLEPPGDAAQLRGPNGLAAGVERLDQRGQPGRAPVDGEAPGLLVHHGPGPGHLLAGIGSAPLQGPSEVVDVGQPDARHPRGLRLDVPGHRQVEQEPRSGAPLGGPTNRFGQDHRRGGLGRGHHEVRLAQRLGDRVEAPVPGPELPGQSLGPRRPSAQHGDPPDPALLQDPRRQPAHLSGADHQDAHAREATEVPLGEDRAGLAEGGRAGPDAGLLAGPPTGPDRRLEQPRQVRA